MAPRCAIAEAKQRYQMPVIGWVTKIYQTTEMKCYL
jgi:hypothetical protein